MKKEEFLKIVIRNLINQDTDSNTVFPEDYDWWDSLQHLAKSNDLIPILYKWSKESDQVMVPENIMSLWRECYYSVARRNMILLCEMKKIIKSLSQAQNKVLVIKGPFLAPIVYKNIALRPMHDIDLIVMEKEFDNVYRVLEDSGYRQSGTEKEKDRHQKLGRFVFEKKLWGELIFVEIHTKILWSFLDLPIVLFFEGPERVRILDFDVDVPERHIHFLYLVVHFINHLRQRSSIIWLVDIALFLKVMELDWGKLMKTFQSTKLEKALFYILNLIKDITGIQVPERNIRELEPGILFRIIYSILKHNNFLLSLYLLNFWNIFSPKKELLMELCEDRYKDASTIYLKMLFWKNLIMRAFRLFYRNKDIK